VLYANAGRDDRDLLAALLRIAPTEMIGAALLVAAGFLAGDAHLAAWIIALAIDYLGPAAVSLHGWRIAPEHFAERYGLVVLIPLGESVIAIGVGAGLKLTTGRIFRRRTIGAIVLLALIPAALARRLS
jgi:low temperature requirement protein LtrA